MSLTATIRGTGALLGGLRPGGIALGGSIHGTGALAASLTNPGTARNQPTVSLLVTDPAGAPVVGAYVEIALVSGTKQPASGYATLVGVDELVAAPVTGYTDALGHFSAALIPNDGLSPAGSAYLVTVTPPFGSPQTSLIRVPDASGPFDVRELLA